MNRTNEPQTDNESINDFFNHVKLYCNKLSYKTVNIAISNQVSINGQSIYKNRTFPIYNNSGSNSLTRKVSGHAFAYSRRNYKNRAFPGVKNPESNSLTRRCFSHVETAIISPTSPVAQRSNSLTLSSDAAARHTAEEYEPNPGVQRSNSVTPKINSLLENKIALVIVIISGKSGVTSTPITTSPKMANKSPNEAFFPYILYILYLPRIQEKQTGHGLNLDLSMSRNSGKFKWLFGKSNLSNLFTRNYRNETGKLTSANKKMVLKKGGKFKPRFRTNAGKIKPYGNYSNLLARNYRNKIGKLSSVSNQNNSNKGGKIKPRLRTNAGKIEPYGNYSNLLARNYRNKIGKLSSVFNQNNSNKGGNFKPRSGSLSSATPGRSIRRTPPPTGGGSNALKTARYREAGTTTGATHVTCGKNPGTTLVLARVIKMTRRVTTRKVVVTPPTNQVMHSAFNPQHSKGCTLKLYK